MVFKVGFFHAEAFLLTIAVLHTATLLRAASLHVRRTATILHSAYLRVLTMAVRSAQPPSSAHSSSASTASTLTPTFHPTGRPATDC